MYLPFDSFARLCLIISLADEVGFSVICLLVFTCVFTCVKCVLAFSSFCVGSLFSFVNSLLCSSEVY